MSFHYVASIECEADANELESVAVPETKQDHYLEEEGDKTENKENLKRELNIANLKYMVMVKKWLKNG